MAYTDNFKHADDLVAHMNSVVPGITDPLLQAKYIGFVSVAAVTVYELALKEIFITFGRKKHKILGNFTESYFERINGRIRIRDIKEVYIPRFGQKYKERFIKNINEREKTYFKKNKRNILSSYGNIITWRNDFAHEGNLNMTATYNEVIQAYRDGKEIIHSLADSMKR